MNKADEIKNILRRHPADWACETLAFILDLEQTVKTYRERKNEELARRLALGQENDALRKERLTATQRVMELEEELARHQHCHSLSENTLSNKIQVLQQQYAQLEEEVVTHQRCHNATVDTLRSHIKVLQEQRARLENTCEHQAREVNELRRNSVKPKEDATVHVLRREVQSLRDEVTRYHARCAELEHRLRKVRLAVEPSAGPKPIAEVGEIDVATKLENISADPAAIAGTPTLSAVGAVTPSSPNPYKRLSKDKSEELMTIYRGSYPNLKRFWDAIDDVSRIRGVTVEISEG